MDEKVLMREGCNHLGSSTRPTNGKRQCSLMGGFLLYRHFLLHSCMPHSTTRTTRPAWYTPLVVIGVVLIALTIRSPLAAVGPLIGAIQEATGLSHGVLGFLTTLPLLCFAFLSLFTPFATRRFGVMGALGLALVLLTTGVTLRSLPGVGALFGGTLLLGIAIALANVLLPSLVKQDFPERQGLMTSVYASLMGIGAALAAGISVPLAEGLPGGWRAALGIWAIPAGVATLLWLPLVRQQHHEPTQNHPFAGLRALSHSPIAWQVALFMGLQSLVFYVVLAWLPEVLIERGMAPSRAGWLLSLSQATGVVGTLVTPIYAERLTSQRVLVLGVVSLQLTGVVGLLLPGLTWAWLWVSLIGLGAGCSFGLALLFLVLRAPDTHATTQLSGMAQAVGYLLAAGGPTLFGYLFEATLSWTLPLALLVVVTLAQLGFGLGAARPQVIER